MTAMAASRPVAPRGPTPPPLTSVGPYRLGRPVNSGSMGVIYDGRTPDDHRVAVKLMRVGLGESGRVRFHREARLLATLAHPAIVACRDHGILPDGRPWLVMEWLDGEDLATRLRRGPLAIDDAIDLAHRLASALAVVHANGVVHRDLKPSNIFLVGGKVGHAKLLDFGVAHADATTQVTQVGDLIGTLGYMAPEQARGEADIDGRADLFSLACVIYECLAGVPAFPGGEPIAVLARLLIDNPPALRQVRPEVPADLEHLLHDMLDKHPAGRPSTARSVVDRLAALSGAAASVAASGPISITAVERRLFVVLFARLPEELGLAATLPAESTASSQILGNFLALAHPFHVHFSPLLGGTLLLSRDVTGSAGDDAALLARRALALRAAFPGIALAMAAGHGTRHESALAGQVLDVAAALLARTVTDAIALDEVTADLLAERFAVDDDGDLRRLASERDTPATRTVLGRPTPFVGRADELELVLAALAATLDPPRAGLVVVTAEAGLGKSRLCHEALAAIASRTPNVLILAAHGTPLGESTALGAIARVVRRIPGDVDAPIAGRILRRVVDVLPDDEAVDVAEALAALAAVLADEAIPVAHIADAGRLAWLRWLEVECARQPVILALDDLHCWDLASLEFVLAALELARQGPLFVLAAGRTEARERAAKLFAHPGAVHLELGPLYAGAGERLVRELLPNTATLVVQSLVRRAQGNAYFLEELIRAAVTGQDGEAPPSVLATVQARLGRLPELDRRLLRAASVFGPTFTDAGVAIVADTPLDEVRPRLAAFEGQELIVRAIAPASAHRVYNFRHALTHEAAHATLTDDDRARGHLAAAAWLETQPAPDYGVIATHFLHGNAHARARRWFLRAAEHAAELGHFDDALRSADRCVELGVTGQDLGLARLVQAEVCAWSSALADGFERAQEAAALLPAGTTPYFRALALSLQVATLRNDLTDVRARVREAFRREPTPGGESGWIRFMCEAAYTAVAIGNADDSAEIMRRLERGTAGRPLPEPAVATILRTRCALRTYARDYEEAIALSRQAADCFTSVGHLRGAAWSRLGVAQALQIVGAFAEAEPIMRSVGALAEKLDAALLLVYQLTRLGTLCLQTDRLDEAHDLLGRALQLSVSRGNSRGVGNSRAALAWYWLERGDPEQAEPLARSACADLGIQRAFMAAGQGFLARTLLAQGRVDEADALVDSFEPSLSTGVIDFEPEHLQTVVAIRGAARGPDAGILALRHAVAHHAAVHARLRTPALRRSYREQRPIREILGLAARHGLETSSFSE